MHLIEFKSDKYFEKDIILPYCLVPQTKISISKKQQRKQ